MDFGDFITVFLFLNCLKQRLFAGASNGGLRGVCGAVVGAVLPPRATQRAAAPV